MTAQRQIPKGQTPARLMARGIDFSDYQKIDYQVNRKGKDFVNVCTMLAEHFYDAAMDKIQANHQLSACRFLYKSAALYRISHYGSLEYDEEKEQLYQTELKIFAKAIELDESFTAERVEIPYHGKKLVGWLMKPIDASDDVPVIMATAGITGFKEEAHYVVTDFLERGMAVFNFDGPGQGESFYEHGVCMEAESEHAHGVIIDYLMQRPDVGNKIGLYGLCMGGLLVARTAVAHQDKVAACVSVGGAYELHTVLLKQSSFIPVFSYRAGVPLDEVIDFSTGLDMQRLLPARIGCPLLIVHNQPDFLIPSSNVKRIYEEASSEDKQFVIFKGAEHNAHNDNAEACALIADWFASRLLLD